MNQTQIEMLQTDLREAQSCIDDALSEPLLLKVTIGHLFKAREHVTNSLARAMTLQPDQKETEIVHRCPTNGSLVMPCCNRTPFEVPTTDRMTLDPMRITCGVDSSLT